MGTLMSRFHAPSARTRSHALSERIRALVLGLCLAAPAFPRPALAQQGTLPAGAGKDVTEIACVTCHSLGYIQMNSRFLSPETWKAEVAKMRNVFGAPIDDDAANAITAYLIAHFGAPAKP